MSLRVNRCQETISAWVVPVAERALSVAVSVKNMAVHFFSPKQSMRQDPLLASARNAAPNLRGLLTLQYWRLYSCFRKSGLDEEAKRFVLALRGIKKLIGEAKENLTPEEKDSLNSFFHRGKFSRAELEKLHLLFIYNHAPDLNASRLALQKMLRMQDEVYFNTLQSKIESVSKCLQGQDMDPKNKLDGIDCIMIGSAASACDLIASLHEQGVLDLDIHLLRWQTIRTFAQSPSFTALKKLCVESRPPGSIFLGSWRNYETFMGHEYSCRRVLEHLFVGRWGHIGIMVALEEEQRSISHVGRSMNRHEIAPIKNEAILPFYDSLDLNIEPLLPKTVTSQDRPILQATFAEAFHRLALEQHPELYLAKKREQLEILLLGHMSPFAQPLSKVDLPNKGGRVHCSGYVGIIFLKAIQEVNLALEQNGYKERIAHPFGSYESIAHLDVLRLLYLWNQLKLIRETPVHPTVAKVLALD